MYTNPYPDNPYCKRPADSPMRKYCVCLQCRKYKEEQMEKVNRKTLTRVKNLNNDKLGTVDDRLSMQFTVNYDDGTHGFLFWKDVGLEWEVVE